MANSIIQKQTKFEGNINHCMLLFEAAQSPNSVRLLVERKLIWVLGYFLFSHLLVCLSVMKIIAWDAECFDTMSKCLAYWNLQQDR